MLTLYKPGHQVRRGVALGYGETTAERRPIRSSAHLADTRPLPLQSSLAIPDKLEPVTFLLAHPSYRIGERELAARWHYVACDSLPGQLDVHGVFAGRRTVRRFPDSQQLPYAQ